MRSKRSFGSFHFLDGAASEAEERLVHIVGWNTAERFQLM